VLVGGRSRVGAAASGLAPLAGSALQRFGVFEAGVASTKDPRYTVVPQRQRLDAAARDGSAVSGAVTYLHAPTETGNGRTTP
jgi:hypothetical protein